MEIDVGGETAADGGAVMAEADQWPLESKMPVRGKSAVQRESAEPQGVSRVEVLQGGERV